jgi:hypothetical protein
VDAGQVEDSGFLKILIALVLGSFHGLRGTSLVGSAEHGFYSGPLSQRFRQAAKPEDEFRLRLKKLLDPPDGALSF